MNPERKLKLLNYLFPREEIRRFMCNDFFIELSYSVPKVICFSEKNCSHARRKANFETLSNLIMKFLQENITYEKIILELYKVSQIEDIIYEIIIGYVLFVVASNNKLVGVDIFKNKKSVCYSPISVVDLL